MKDNAGRPQMVMLGIRGGGIEVVYRKTWLGGWRDRRIRSR